jgi:hypothetical protein
LPNRTRTACPLRSQAADRSSPWLRRASYSRSPALWATSSSPEANSPSSASVGASWSPRRRCTSCSAWRLSTAESLPAPRSDAVRPASFPRRSQPRLLTGAIRGGLLAPPARRQRTACLHLFHSAAKHRTAPTRPTNYRSGHTYAEAFERNRDLHLQLAVLPLKLAQPDAFRGRQCGLVIRVRFPVFLQSGRPVPELGVLRIRRAPPRGDDEIRGSSAAWR